MLTRCNAKLLWRRIPENVKASNPELGAIWKIGQSMWVRNFAGVHAALAERETWSEPVTSIMEALKGENR
jgi:COP9 signalosome complex subunit 8